MWKRSQIFRLPGCIGLFLILLLPSAHSAYSANLTPAEAAAPASTTTAASAAFSNTIINVTSALDTNSATIALDSEGNYHFAYVRTYSGDNGLVYTFVDPVTGPELWQEAYNSYNERMPSMAVDKLDKVHIIFVRDDVAGKGNIVEAEVLSTNWIYTPVAESADDEIAPSVAVDPWGYLHVVYMRKIGTSNFEIYYATNYTGTWVNTRLTNNATPDFYPTIAIDGSGNPHVAYMRDGVIYYATNSSGVWVTGEVVSGTGIYTQPSIAVGAAGYIYLAYQHVYQEPTTSLYEITVYYATNRYGSWVHEQVTQTFYWPDYQDAAPQIALDNGNRAYIVYQNPTDLRVYMASHTGYLKWQKTVVSGAADALPFSVNDRSFLIDHQGYAVVTYTGAGSPTNIIGARSTSPVGPVWEFAYVGTSEYQGFAWDTDIMLDTNDLPYISYYDAPGTALSWSFLLKNDPDWQMYALGPYTPGVNMGQYNGIYISAAGGLSMPFYDVINGDLLVYDSKISPTPPPLDSQGDVGRYLSYAAAETKRHISYYDATNKHLKYAVAGAPAWAWTTRTVDSALETGWFTSIDLDSMGYPHIAYYDANQHTLKYAAFDGSAWHIETVDTGILFYGMAFDISLEMEFYEGDDYPHIAYYDAANSALKYARWDGALWRIETVDNNGDVGQFNSMVLASDGSPRIAYYDFYNRDVKIARRDGWDWQYAWVDCVGAVGQFLSMDLDILNDPHIAYFDATENKVKYARLHVYPVYIPMVMR